MSCCNCQGSLPEVGAILMNCDGDFTCSENCEKEYKKKREHFFKHIVHCEAKTRAWLLGK